MNLWATVAQAAVYSIVSISVGMYYKRVISRDREKLERIINGVEAVFGITTTTDPVRKKGITMFDPAVYKKGIAAGFGVILTGLLTWAETADLEPIIGPMVPEVFRPLVGVVLGGIALTASVILTKNKPKPAPEDAAPVVAATPMAPIWATTDAPFWAGIPASAPQAVTSKVDLVPEPEQSYL